MTWYLPGAGFTGRPYWPVIAVIRLLKRDDRKVRVAWYRTVLSAKAACSCCASTVLPSSAGARGTRYFRLALASVVGSVPRWPGLVVASFTGADAPSAPPALAIAARKSISRAL